MDDNFQTANRVQVKIVNTLWERASPALAIVPLESQRSLAIASLALGFVLLAVYLMNGGKRGSAGAASSVLGALILAFGALFLAFGAVFLVNAVRVYTG